MFNRGALLRKPQEVFILDIITHEGLGLLTEITVCKQEEPMLNKGNIQREYMKSKYRQKETREEKNELKQLQLFH